MCKIVAELHLDEKTARKKAEGYKSIARKPKAMYSTKTNSWYVLLCEVEPNKVQQARYYFKSKGVTAWELLDE